MRPRIYPLGDRNIVGARVAELRKAAGWKQVEFMAMLQLRGMEISATGLSKLEGQSRRVTDRELSIIAATLHTTPNTLLKWERGKRE